MIVFTNEDDYNEPKDLGAALRFIGQAFKHCKTIGATQAGEILLKRATQGLYKDGAGIVVSRQVLSGKDVQSFIKDLSEHRHWSREKAAATLPY